MGNMGRPVAEHHIGAAEARRIRRALENAGVTQAALAAEAGVSRQAVNNVLAGTTSSKRIAELIRKVAGGWDLPAASDEDERDAEIARTRLAEIEANPGSVLRGAALGKSCRNCYPHRTRRDDGDSEP